MAVRVLVVDDSGFFRRRIEEILNSDPAIEVVGTAADGREAILKAGELKPDVITMDIEMPVMDGITATRRIMALHRIPIVMFSSLTHEGAKATLDALDAGAVDFLPKKFEDISQNRDEARRVLCDKIKAAARSRAMPSTRLRAGSPDPGTGRAVSGTATTRPVTTRTPPAARPSPGATPAGGLAPGRLSVDLVGIGTSTGGPVALQKVLTALPAGYGKPIVMIQHMPASFTPAFAQRLDQLCRIEVREARDGDALRPGLALLAPGGKQMLIEKGRVRVIDGDPAQHYKPCVDLSFSSIAKAYPGRALGIILTGMGADGREGCREMKATGCPIWSQDEATSVVYGMPAAVAEAGLSDAILPLDRIGPELASKT